MSSSVTKKSAGNFVPSLIIKPSLLSNVADCDANEFSARRVLPTKEADTCDGITKLLIADEDDNKENVSVGNLASRRNQSPDNGTDRILRAGGAQGNIANNLVATRRQSREKETREARRRSREHPGLSRPRRLRSWEGNCGLTLKTDSEFSNGLEDCLLPEFSWSVTILPRLNCGRYSVANVTDLWRTGLSLTISEIRSLVDFHGWCSDEKRLLRKVGSREDLLGILDQFQNEGARELKREACQSWGVLATRVSEVTEHCNGYIKCLHFWEMKFSMADVAFVVECTGLLIF
jgi:hypothetical protein